MESQTFQVLTDNTTRLILDPGLKIQTIVPSAIKIRSEDDVSRPTVASTLLSQERKGFVETEPLSNGWTRIKHPDSGVYFVHKHKGLSTASDVSNPGICSRIMQGADILQRSPALKAVLEDLEITLVLDVRHGNGPVSYYCVSHVERRVFWLEGIGHEEVDVPCTSNKCTTSKGSSGVHCIEAQYWKHCELFPTTLPVNKNVIGDLKDVLLQAAADRLLVKFSTSPFNKQDLEYMLNVVKEIDADVQEESGHAAWIVARFMALYNDGMLRSSHGQSDDYFDIDDTGPKLGPYQRPILLTILAPLFFKSPDVYAVELHSFHESFSLARWTNFVHKVDQSIRDSNLLATVLLSTNMGFLAWSENGKAGDTDSPTAAQIVTYISIICSVGSIIVGLVIFKQYRAKGADTPLRAVVVLKRILKEPFGLERLAIICSLPYVLLMWGLIAFLASFGIIFYEQTGIQVRIPVSVALALIFVCLFFCLYTAGPPGKEDQEPQKRPQNDRAASLPKVEGRILP